ncbi:MAG: PilN domain-containing protein, partial [Bacteriovoracaceae bacterium]|nr:PilN domain-containing protein [Bacteriovoracaceae bacterium]
VGGINFSLLNVKMLLLALFVLYVPEVFLESHYEELIQTEQAEQVKLNQEYRKIRGKVAGLQNIEKQVQALKSQEEKLAKKLEVVKEIINKRQNPFNVLKYVAQNIPEGVWLVDLNLEGNQLALRGYSQNFKNIGKFLENLKNSIFFNKNNIIYERPDSLPNEVDGVFLEVFEIKAGIVSFE